MATAKRSSSSTPKGMAPTSTRALWKGAITFGLVHIPIGLYSATAESGVDFDWLDKRSMDPVGYKRVNKKTGKEIARDDIVKGVKWHGGDYVVLSPQEIQAAYPRTTQTIEIEAFVDADEVPFVYLERPYYVGPVNKGDKVYALLREALKQTNKVGIARVVIQTRQHLAVVIPNGPALVLNLLRWGGEIRSWEDLKLPPSDAKSAGVKESELKMARQLIEGMTAHWSADQFRDSFKEEIMKLVEAKAEAGDTEHVTPVEEAPSGGSNVIDLTDLLKRSLAGGGRAPREAPAPAAAPAARKGARSAGKTAAKAGTDKRKPAGKSATAKSASAKSASAKSTAAKTRSRKAA
ncbi:non-homologous end joining protein Ku [Ramlibacter sp. Leaf400]|uniref:non-homologous end joining protein Ku n=1 Tax=Ramlibacter sp. Leaf400 TaxID=1736365 RepID=UPI0006F541A6|nr:Ku protein [Ramlibacter sp. Leaf400]KQT13816.1 DNA-binding protein [Ramlibacter sp. Leaf400]